MTGLSDTDRVRIEIAVKNAPALTTEQIIQLRRLLTPVPPRPVARDVNDDILQQAAR